MSSICKYVKDVEEKACIFSTFGTSRHYNATSLNVSGLASAYSLTNSCIEGSSFGLHLLIMEYASKNPIQFLAGDPTASNQDTNIETRLKKMGCLTKTAILVLGAPLMSIANIVYHAVATVFSAIKLILALAPCTRFKVTEEAGKIGRAHV